MHPMLVHHCSACSANTPVPFSASVFSQQQYCQNCSAVSHGVTIQVPELDATKQRKAAEEMQQQDELAALFAQQMSFAPAPAPAPAPPSQPTPPPEPAAEQKQQQQMPTQEDLSPAEEPKRASSEPITFVSTHYTHSSHVRITSPPPSNPSSSPPSNPQFSRSELEAILQQHSINPSLLFPSQLTLFQSASPDQRLRLLELWRICPPSAEEHERCWESGTWPDSTSLQNEEDMARRRWEVRERLHRAYLEQEQEKRRQREEWERHQDPHFRDAMDDDDVVVVYRNAEDAAPAQHAEPPAAPKQAEPYMLSGYESLARRDYEEQARLNAQRDTMAMEGMSAPLQETTRYNQATDPAYYRGWEKSAGGVNGHVTDMENQYGRIMGFQAGDDDEMTM